MEIHRSKRDEDHGRLIDSSRPILTLALEIIRSIRPRESTVDDIIRVPDINFTQCRTACARVITEGKSRM